MTTCAYSDPKQRSWRFWMISGYVLIVLVFVVVWLWSLYGPLNNEIVSEQTDELTAIANAGALGLESFEGNTDDYVSTAVQGTSLRMTIVAGDGTVLADSSQDATTLENHLDRPEVAEALSGRTGTDERTSASNGDPELYVAVPASYEGETVALRVSSPISSIRKIASGMRMTGIVLIGLGILLAGLIAWRSYRSAAHPVDHLERVRTDFVANASHELKTPVAGIRLLSDAISQSSADGDLEQTRVFAQRLDSEASRLQHLVTDLLDLSRLESADKEGIHLRSDLHSSVTTSFEAHRAQARAKGLVFELVDETRPDDGCYVGLDASDASLIADNLLDNAICYTERGSITVSFRLDGGSAVIAVSDTGIGIPPSEQSRIFERFYRVDKARSREVGGTGLGLALVRHAALRGGGTVEVESTPGAGSTFTVRIPLVSTGRSVG